MQAQAQAAQTATAGTATSQPANPQAAMCTFSWNSIVLVSKTLLMSPHRIFNVRVLIWFHNVSCESNQWFCRRIIIWFHVKNLVSELHKQSTGYAECQSDGRSAAIVPRHGPPAASIRHSQPRTLHLDDPTALSKSTLGFFLIFCAILNQCKQNVLPFSLPYGTLDFYLITSIIRFFFSAFSKCIQFNFMELLFQTYQQSPSAISKISNVSF